MTALVKDPRPVATSDGQEVKVGGLRLRGYSILKQAALRTLWTWPEARSDAPIRVLIAAAILAKAPEIIADSTDLTLDEVQALAPADGDKLLMAILDQCDLPQIAAAIAKNLQSLVSALGDSTPVRGGGEADLPDEVSANAGAEPDTKTLNSTT